jgi:formylglycine-generating enzyme required for sulfatase activity
MAKKDRTNENKVRIVKNDNSSDGKRSSRILSNGLRKYFAAALTKLDFIEFGDPSEYLKKKHNIEIPTTELSSIWIPPIFNDEHTNKEITFASFLEESNPQLVLADPGCGKSTLSRFLTCTYIKKYRSNEQDYFGMFVPLDRFRKPKNIEEEIAYCAAEFAELEKDGEVIEALKENILNACIIFDGYDESPSSRANQSDEHPIAIRPEVAQMISSLTVNAMISSENEKQQRFIVLCRRIDYKGYKKESQLSITPKLMTKFSSKQMNNAVMNWHQAAIEGIKKYDSSESKVVPNLTLRLKEIQSVLLEHSDLAEICLTPFMLNALQTVDLDAKDLPSSVSQLCWRAVNWFFIDKHHEPDKVLLVSEFGKCILEIITEIGYSIQESVVKSDKPKNLGDLELRKLTKQAFKTNGINEKYEDDVLEQKITHVVSFLKRGHGIFIYRSSSEDDEFEFVHNIFREVVAGRWLLKKEVVELTDYALSWGWHGPIRYWAGFKAVEKDGLYAISSFVDELTQEQYKDNVQAILACGEMLVEVISCVKPHLITAGIKTHIRKTSEKLCKLLKQDSLLLVQRIRIGDLLAILEDPRLKTKIEERLTTIVGGTYKIGRSEKHITTINKKYEDCPAFPITNGSLQEFKIGNYLVTNKEFKEFIDAEGYKKAKYWQSEIGWKWAQGDVGTLNFLILEATKVGRLHLTSELAGQRIIIDDIPERCVQMIKRSLPMYWSDPAFNRSNQPVVGINWWETLAYCNWIEETLKNSKIIKESQTVRLPIEAEWETAARLCGNNNIYPWTNGEPSNCALVKGAFIRDSEPPILTPKIRSCGVGLFDFVQSQLPIYDLVGNVWEWTASRVQKYNQDSFKQTFDVQGMDDRIARGSSWLSSEEESSQVTFRSFDPPYNAYEDLGFRIVIT